VADMPRSASVCGTGTSGDWAMPERMNTCAAPVPELWQGAPTTVVDPEMAAE
jgi:hypothetical protein